MNFSKSMDRKSQMRVRLARKLAERQNRDPAEAEQQKLMQIAQNLQTQVGNRKLNKKQQKKVAQKLQTMQKNTSSSQNTGPEKAPSIQSAPSEEAPPPQEL